MSASPCIWRVARSLRAHGAPGRIGISGQALGIGQAAVDEATALLKERARGQLGSPHPAGSLREQADLPTWWGGQGDEFTLADMATRLESARLLAYHAAWLCTAGRPFTRSASIAKLHCTDTSIQLALDALQLAGAEAAVSGSPF